MTKEIFVDRSGKQIDRKNLQDYDMVGFVYDEENDAVIWTYTKRFPLPVLGYGIAVLFGLCLCAIIIWFVISLI